MRLGVDVATLGPIRSGVSRYLWSMIASMMGVAPDIEFLLYSQRPFEVPLLQGNWRARVDSRSGWMPYPLWLQRRCPLLLAADGVDVFWGQNYMLPLKLRHSCFRLLTVHDLTAVLFPQAISKIGRLTSRLYFRKAVRAADGVIAVSQATARLARLYLGAEERVVRVVYLGNGSGFVTFHKARAQALVAEKFGLPSDYLLTVGNIEPRKSHASLLSALETVSGAPVLAIVGNIGWRHGPIMAAIRRHELAGRVKFLGRVEDADLVVLYSAAKLTIYPSFYEGFGLPVLEAMACGCPVLCSWSSSLPEVGGAAARYFRPHDVGDLSWRIGRLLSDESLLAEMRIRGVEQAARFSYDKAAVQLVGLLREALRDART